MNVRILRRSYLRELKGVRSQYYCPLTPAEGITPSNFFYLLAFCGYSFK